MKGLLYCAAKLNRGYLITAAVFFLCAAVAGSVILMLKIGDTLGIGSLVITFLPIIPSFILCEFLDRDLEKSIKSGFLSYVLSSMRREKLVLTHLIINLSCIIIGAGMGCALLGIYSSAAHIPLTNYFVTLPMVSILAGVVEWVVYPLTLKIKSAEKAGLLVGLVIGFGIIMPLIMYLKTYCEYSDVIDTLVSPSTLLIEAAAAVVIYAVVFVINLRLLKRGI